MTGPAAERREFVEVLRKLLNERQAPSRQLDSADEVRALLDALGGAGVLGLAQHTAGMSDSLDWLAVAVGEVAAVTPSIAFTLAAHYTAHRAALAAEQPADESLPQDGMAATGVVTGAGRAVLPTVLRPGWVLLLADAPDSATLASADAYHVARVEVSGLRGAGLRELSLQDHDLGHGLSSRASAQARRDWNLLCAAVSLGIAESSLRSAEDYARARRQFGSPLAAFAALRSMLTQMRLRHERASALLEKALRAEAAEPHHWLAAADAACASVSIALDAIQIHGGYGYIEEYPVARHLRDAISVNARCGGRRVALAHAALDRLSTPGWEARW